MDSSEVMAEFLTEATELLENVDMQLVELERRPRDRQLLDEIFRSFHTIKGGAGFLDLQPMVVLCHHTESLFDKLRQNKRVVDAPLMDVILQATAAVRAMFAEISQGQAPAAPPETLLAALQDVPGAVSPAVPEGDNDREPDWGALYAALVPADSGEAGAVQAAATGTGAVQAVVRAAAAGSVQPNVSLPPSRESTMRVDIRRLDTVLDLSGEIGLARNRLNCTRDSLLMGMTDPATLKTLDEVVSHLDLLVSNLQNAVLKTRMQPIGRLFQKFPRMTRELARQLGKQIFLDVAGEDTEIDKTMIEDLGDPLVHLLRNAVDHGADTPEERRQAGKSPECTIRLQARQAGDQIVIEIADDGRGMNPALIRQKALDKGLVDPESVHVMDDRQSLALIFLPGFSTREVATDLSGRGVGMDVVKTNIQKLNGRIDIQSQPGQGTTFTIYLPLTLSIMAVMVVRLDGQAFALPLSMVREVLHLAPGDIQQVGGRGTCVLRDQILPVRSLAGLLGVPQPKRPAYGLLMEAAEQTFVLAVDEYVGKEEAVIKPLQDIKPRGVAGATLAGDGEVILVLDIESLVA